MTNFKEFLNSILRDMIQAQHEANMYALSLQEAYKQTGKAGGMTPPAVSLGEIELNLRYAVAGDLEQREVSDIDYAETRRILQHIAQEAAPLSVRTIIKGIQESGLPYQEDYGFIDNLNKNLNFIQMLEKRYLAFLIENEKELLTADNRLDIQRVVSLLEYTADDQILQNSELVDLFQSAEGKAALEIVQKKISEAMNKEVDDFIRECNIDNFTKIQQMGSLNVIIDAQELSKLPSETIQSCHVKITPQLLSKLTNEND